MKIYTPYQQYIRQCLADVYRFLDTHKQPRTNEDWAAIAETLKQYKDPFTSSLLIACVNELEREYTASKKMGVD